MTPSISRSYDAAGRLLTLNNGVSCLSYTYDAANQLLSETQNIGCGGAGVSPVAYSYDADGNRATLTYPNGTVVAYTYTARNQPASQTVVGAGEPLVTYGYDTAGNRISKTLANGTSAGYTYDVANRLLTLVHSNSAGQFARFDYTLNSVGNRTSKTQVGTAGSAVLSESYAYDAIDQITNADYATNSVITRSVSYNYDPVGNRTTVSDGGTTTYTANNLNQYTQVGSDTPTYDGKGNLASQGAWTYTYDAQNRLVNAASNGVTIAIFGYDARNRCVARTINGAASFFTWDAWSLLEERDANGTLKDKYVHGGHIDEILVRYNGSPIWYHHDGLGSVSHITEGTSAVVESYTYDVYGAPSFFNSAGLTQAASHVAQRFLFTGREWLAEVGLYDFRNRAYSQFSGRFLQTDPIRFMGGDVNLYRYVENGPILGIDPDGLKRCFDHTQYTRDAAACRTRYQTDRALVDQNYQIGIDAIEEGCRNLCSNFPSDFRPECEMGCEAAAEPLRFTLQVGRIEGYLAAAARKAGCLVAAWRNARYEVPDGCPCRRGGR